MGKGSAALDLFSSKPCPATARELLHSPTQKQSLSPKEGRFGRDLSQVLTSGPTGLYFGYQD